MQHYKMSVAFSTNPISSKVPGMPEPIIVRGLKTTGALIVGLAVEFREEPFKTFTSTPLDCKKTLFLSIKIHLPSRLWVQIWPIFVPKHPRGER